MCVYVQKLEYSEDQREVAELLHPMLVDLLANHKLGICFRDKSLGLSNESVNTPFFIMSFGCLFYAHFHFYLKCWCFFYSLLNNRVCWFVLVFALCNSK